MENTYNNNCVWDWVAHFNTSPVGFLDPMQRLTLLGIFKSNYVPRGEVLKVPT